MNNAHDLGSGRRTALRAAFVVVLLVLLVIGNAPERTLFWRTLFNAGHAPLFGVLALIIRSMAAHHGSAPVRARASLIAFAASAFLGVAGEALQTLQPDRDVSLDDLLRDAAGAAAFLLLRAAWVRRTARGVRAGGPWSRGRRWPSCCWSPRERGSAWFPRRMWRATTRRRRWRDSTARSGNASSSGRNTAR